MAEKLTTLAKRLRPFLNGQISAIAATGAFMTEGPDIDLVGNRIGRGGDAILLFDSAGAPVAEFAMSDAGFTAALAAATSGDVIVLPAGTITGNHTIPAGVSVWGFGWNSVLSGVTTNNGILNFCRITGTLTNGDEGSAFYMADIPLLGHDVQRTIQLSSDGFDPGSTIKVVGTGSTGNEGGAYFVAEGRYEAAIELHNTSSTALKQYYRWNSISDVLKAQLINETTGTVIRDLITITDTGNLTSWGGIANLPWYDAKLDGGLVGNGVTDDTAALQTLINTAAAAGTHSAWIYFPPGTYLIGGALQDTGARNGQIVLPTVALSANQKVIHFMGATRPPFQWSGPTVPAPGGYSIIKSTLAGASGNASVISGGNAANNISVVMDDLILLAPDNPTFTFLNFAYTQGGAFRNIQITTPGGLAATPVEPTNSNSYGIKLPQKLYSNYTHIEGLSVGSFYTCVLDGELSIYKGLILGNCIVCVEVPESFYPSLFLTVQNTGFQYGFRGTGTHYFDVINYCAEHSITPAWRQTVYDLDDASNYLHGHIHYQNGVTGGAIDHNFTKNGGTYITAHEIGSAEGVTFSDAEGDPVDVDRTARSDGASTYAARRDHRHELGTVNLDHLSDVDTTGTSTGDIIYNNAGTWEDYPLGIGSKVSVTSNKIRFGNASGGNYLEIDLTTGNLRLVGNATQWDDLRVSASVAKPGATAPAYKAFGPSGNLQALMFEAGHHDEVFFEIQMPHNWKEGSDIHPHVHWTPTDTTAGNVVWELEYSWANIDGTFGAPSNMATDARAAGGVAWVHKMDDFKTGGVETISGTGKTLSSMLVCRLHRNSNSGSDTLNKDVALLEFDLHYEVDSFGSDTELIKDTTSALLLETGDYLLLENGDNLLLE